MDLQANQWQKNSTANNSIKYNVNTLPTHLKWCNYNNGVKLCITWAFTPEALKRIMWHTELLRERSLRLHWDLFASALEFPLFCCHRSKTTKLMAMLDSSNGGNKKAPKAPHCRVFLMASSILLDKNDSDNVIHYVTSNQQWQLDMKKSCRTDTTRFMLFSRFVFNKSKYFYVFYIHCFTVNL